MPTCGTAAAALREAEALVKSLAHTEGWQGGSDSTQPPPALYPCSPHHPTALTVTPRVPLSPPNLPPWLLPPSEQELEGPGLLCPEQTSCS